MENLKRKLFNKLFVIQHPFVGHCNTVVRFFDDNTNQVSYRPVGFTWTDYCRQYDGSIADLELVTEKQFDALIVEHIEKLKTRPVSISFYRFNEMKDVLPPNRWGAYSAYEIFHGERISYNLVTWYVKSFDKCYQFNDVNDISYHDIVDKIKSLQYFSIETLVVRMTRYGNSLRPSSNKAQCFNIANFKYGGNETIAQRLARDHSTLDGCYKAANLMKSAGCATETGSINGAYGVFSFPDGSILDDKKGV